MNNLNYGAVGNCNTAALVSEKGSIDWLCMPKFNSASIFAKLLDKEKGGSFEIVVDKSYKTEQKYLRNTNILITCFTGKYGAFEVIDFMPRYQSNGNNYYAPPDLIRYFRWIHGKPEFRIKYNPKLEYGLYPCKTKVMKDYIKSYTTRGEYDSVYLYTGFDLHKVLNGEALELKEDGYFLLSYNQKLLEQTVDRSYLKLQRTHVYWLNWSERTKKYKKYNEEINRSALVLKLLTYDKTGAILAALTTSLPETIGEERNWDYRFCWIRDASMTIKILNNLGHFNVASRYLNFIVDIVPDKDEKIQIMYGINKEKKLTEKILKHFKGYEGSQPVRIGNDAYKQKQNDIYGVLMDVIYEQFSYFHTTLANSEDFWTIVRSIARTVKKNWKKPDRGIWEIRTDQKHFTFSKVLCWVAIDRAVKIAKLLNKKSYMKDWEKLRDDIHADVINNAWNEKLQSFTQYYDSNDLDASNLLMENYGFISATDPKYVSTVKATKKHLMHNNLMYRYKNKDDFGLPNSSFTICTFWMINSLKKIGQDQEAEKLFDEILQYSNHLGLFSEDIDFKSKRLLGNFPQAYSHLALIETAINLADEKLSKDEKVLEAIR